MKNFTAQVWSFVVTAWTVVTVTVTPELSKPFMAVLKQVTGHHWVTKSLGAVALFFLLYGIFLKVPDRIAPRRAVWIVILNAVFAGLAIFFFFVWLFVRE